MQIGQAAARQFAVSGSALLALFLGTSVYLLDRDWATVQFLVPFAVFQGERANLFGTLGQVLPSLCHAYAFSLLLILALGRTRGARFFGALAWFVVAAGLEALQSLRFSVPLTGLTGPPADSPVLGSIANYAANGHFDPGDLVAAGLGCVAACLVASAQEKANEYRQ
jgi:hypothetical protein